jgi:hypothetical protein
MANFLTPHSILSSPCTVSLLLSVMLSSGIRAVWFDRLSSARRCSGGHLGSDLLVKLLAKLCIHLTTNSYCPDVSIEIQVFLSTRCMLELCSCTFEFCETQLILCEWSSHFRHIKCNNCETWNWTEETEEKLVMSRFTKSTIQTAFLFVPLRLPRSEKQLTHDTSFMECVK